jgi:hypothetical protein
MLRNTDPVWSPFGPLTHPAQHYLATNRTRWLWLVPLAAGFLSVLGWVTSHDPAPGLALSRRGWITIAAAGVVAVQLAIHRRDGIRGLLRAIAEYAVVLTLAVLIATTPAGGASGASGHQGASDAKATAKAATATGGAAACPSVAHARLWLTCLWHQASEATKTAQQTTQTSKK